MTERDKPHNLPSLIRFPYVLPDRFVAKFGYDGQDPLVGMFWQGAGDELAVYVRAPTLTRMHQHAVYLALIRQPKKRLAQRDSD